MARDVHVAILAGGSGTRFWPLSRELSPKQMMRVFHERSLLTSAIERGAKLVTGQGTIQIVVGAGLYDETRNHITSNPAFDALPISYVVEPLCRDTAPALALAAATLKNTDPDGTLVMMPADHIIDDGPAFAHAMRAAITRARTGDLVVIGLVPTEPATAYGYIKMGEELMAETPAHAAVYRAEQFVEKPDADTAASYLAQGGYLWNSGMVVATPRAILAQMRTVGSEIVGMGDVVYHGDNVKICGAAEMLADMGEGTHAMPVAQHIYGALPAVPFDRAVLELSDRVAVVPATFAWSDVGSLTSLDQLAEPDERGNRTIGRGLHVDSTDTLIYSADRLVATLGLDDIVVVDTADATLVARRDRLQDVKLVVAALKESGAPELVQSKTSLRPWGSWTMLTRGVGYHVKEIEVRPGARLSLQSHKQRAEHWIVVEGMATVERDNETIVLSPNESVFLPSGSRHRLSNAGDSTLRLVEVATGEYLGEDDIVRYQDDFGRGE